MDFFFNDTLQIAFTEGFSVLLIIFIVRSQIYLDFHICLKQGYTKTRETHTVTSQNHSQLRYIILSFMCSLIRRFLV